MSSTTRIPRLAAALLTGGLLLAPLAGCTFSSDNVSCSGGTCTVTLSGDGAKAEILGTTLTLGEIQDGTFAREWVAEDDNGRPNFTKLEEEGKAHQIEQVGAKLRGLMPWMARPTT